jgi:hypothetical protein
LSIGKDGNMKSPNPSSSARQVAKARRAEAIGAAVVESAARTGEWSPQFAHQQADQFGTPQNGINVFAELKQQKGRWLLVRQVQF